MLITLLNILFAINCLVLIGAILLQAGQGGGLGAGLSGGTQTTAVFGGRGPGALLAKATIGCATIFMSASLLLAYLSSKPQSVLDLTGEDQVVGNTEDDVIEEGTLDIKLKALSGDKDNKAMTIKPKANPIKVNPIKVNPTKVAPKAKLPVKPNLIKLPPKTAPKATPKADVKTAPKTAPKAATKAAPKTP